MLIPIRQYTVHASKQSYKHSACLATIHPSQYDLKCSRPADRSRPDQHPGKVSERKSGKRQRKAPKKEGTPRILAPWDIIEFSRSRSRSPRLVPFRPDGFGLTGPADESPASQRTWPRGGRNAAGERRLGGGGRKRNGGG